MMNKISIISCMSFCLFFSCWSTDIDASNWPMYRANAARSGHTSETLPSKLQLRWSYTHRHVPQPAWPRNARMPFDRAFHTVIAEGRIFYGSSVDGRVYAHDANTGSPLWSFTTAGPIRFAPVIHKNLLLVASDDGLLYALAVKDGSVIWKHRGGPDQTKLIGNQRMISKWPARGGPVVIDDTVYYAAGIWPTDGIYLYALNASTGKEVWCNEDSGKIYMSQPHGGANANSGVSAQGFLVAGSGHLIVPTGRAVPAVFDRKTGKFLYFHLQRYGHRGGTPTMLYGSYFFNSGIPFNTKSGIASKSVGSGPIAATKKGIIRVNQQKIEAYDFKEYETVDRKGKKRRTRGFVKLWSAKVNHACVSLITTGNLAITGGTKIVSIIDLNKKTTVWSAPIKGIAHGLAVSDGKLYVSTDQGVIYCFDSKPVKKPSLLKQKSQPAKVDPLVAKAAEEILKKYVKKQGYCLDLDCGNGQLCLELARRSQLRIIALQPDEEKAKRVRALFEASEIDQSQIQLFTADLKTAQLPRYFADLIISTKTLSVANIDSKHPALQRVLRPYGGMLITGRLAAMSKETRGPLQGAGNWTHQYTNAANTLCSDDSLVKGQLSMLWYRDVDVAMPQRHGRGPAPLSAQGRLYSMGLDELACVDAYNGRDIWRYSLKGILGAYDGDELMGVSGTGGIFCYADQSIYVRLQDRCLRIDAATGKLLGTFLAPKPKKSKKTIWGYIACEDGVLYGSLVNPEHLVTYRYVNRGKMKQQFTESNTFFAMDAKTGKLRWRYDAKHSIRHNAIAIGKKTTYLIDRPVALSDRSKKKNFTKHATGILKAIDSKNGEILWSNDQNIYGTVLALSTKHSRLLMSYQPTRFKLDSEVGKKMSVFASDTGKRIWEKQASYSSRPLINDYTIYAQGGAWDLLTGTERPFPMKRSYGCGILAGSKHLMLFRSATLGYYNLENNKQHKTVNFGGIRPGCWINAIASGGLVLVPDASAGCQCSYLNKAWFALQPETVTTPQATPVGKIYHKPIQVKLSSDQDDVKIRYTTDGSNPQSNSPLYQNPIRINKTTILKMKAFAADGTVSDIYRTEYKIVPQLKRQKKK